MKKISEFLSENKKFLVVEFSIYLNRRVLVMNGSKTGSFVVVLLCLCVSGFISGVCFVFICFSSLIHFGASAGLCVVIATFPGYLHILIQDDKK